MDGWMDGLSMVLIVRRVRLNRKNTRAGSRGDRQSPDIIIVLTCARPMVVVFRPALVVGFYTLIYSSLPGILSQ